MKKRQFMFMAIILTIILAGCSNKEYDEAMESGKNAIEKEEYQKAQSSFEQAFELKSDDQEAKDHLDQTKNMIEASELFNDGNLDEATKSFNNMLNLEEGSVKLEKEAETKLAEIEEIETTYHNTETSFKEAEELEKKGDFKDALSLIDELLDQDLTHPAFSSLNKELESFKTKLQDTKNNYDSVRQAHEEVKKLGDNKNYKKAISLIDETLKKDFSHPSLNSLEEDLTKLKTDLVTAQKESEEQNKKEDLINQVTGYWSNTENEYELCHFTKNQFVCAIAASDFYYYGRISSWDIESDNKTLIINGDGNSSGKASISNSNILKFGEATYNPISKQDAKSTLDDFGIDDMNEFFDINRYEEWDS